MKANVDYSLLQGAIENILGKGVKKARTNVAFHCPFCNHRLPKLEIDMQTDNTGQNPWACWVCQTKGRTIRSLLSHLHISRAEAQQVLQFVRNGEVEEYREQKNIKLPEEFVPLHIASKTSIDIQRVKNYLFSRGLVEEDFIRYNIGYCSKGMYENHVIIPSYDSNNCLNYFIARNLDSSSSRRYKNPDVSRDITFFENLINWNEPIVVCEGVFDAFAIRRNVTCLLGKNISNSLMKNILEHPVPEIYVCLDSDALKTAIKCCEKFLAAGKRVYLVRPEAKDPGEQGFNGFTKQLQQAEELTLKDLITYKLDF